MKLNITIKKNIVPLIVLKRRLAMLAETKTEVGFFADAMYDESNDNLPVAQVARWQEYGLNMEIPSRPFFTTALYTFTRGSNRIKLLRRMQMAAQMWLFKKMSPIPAMQDAGEVIKQEIQDQIERWRFPRNSDKTIAAKGENNPLIDTEHMYDSVAFRVVRRK